MGIPLNPFYVVILHDAFDRTSDGTHETNRIDFLLHMLHSFKCFCGKVTTKKCMSLFYGLELVTSRKISGCMGRTLFGSLP
jgi:hypothetical protein